MMDRHRHSELIDALGGTMTVARLCKVTPPTVSGWRKRGIPRGWLAFLEQHRQTSQAGGGQ